MNILKLTNAEKEIIYNAIKKHPLNMSAAARTAKIPFSSFIRRAKKLNVYRPNPGQPELRKQKQRTAKWDDCSLIEKHRRVLEEQNGKCLLCGISEWRNVKITLEYDHIDGNNTNENRDNVRYLCPNCHSMTPTFRNKNRDNVGTTKISDAELEKAILSEKNTRQALLKVGLAAKAGNYKRVERIKNK